MQSEFCAWQNSLRGLERRKVYIIIIIIIIIIDTFIKRHKCLGYRGIYSVPAQEMAKNRAKFG